MRDTSTLPRSVVAIVGTDADVTRRVTAAIRRVLEPKRDVPFDVAMDFNPPMPRSLASDVTSSKRRYRLLDSGVTDADLPPRALDAAALVLSATTSVHEQWRRLAFALDARSKCPLVVFVTRCSHPDAVRDLVEIEAREFLEAMGRSADEVPFVFSSIDPAVDDDDSVLALIDLFDEMATVCAQTADTPVVARVDRDFYDGWTSVELYSGLIAVKQTLGLVWGATLSDRRLLALRGYSPTKAELGLGTVNASFDVAAPEGSWLVSTQHAKDRSVIELAVFEASELAGRWSDECIVTWAGNAVRGSMELESLGSVAPNLGRARVTLSQPMPFVSRAYVELNATWPMGECAAIVLPDDDRPKP
jgi:hypothetical protein